MLQLRELELNGERITARENARTVATVRRGNDRHSQAHFSYVAVVAFLLAVFSNCAAIGSAQGSGEWTWVSGRGYGSTAGIDPVYGTVGEPGLATTAGGVQNASSWIDPNGNLWLFGGLGVCSSTGGTGDVNTMWKFTPSTTEWTWIGGSNSCYGGAASYGTLGKSSATNIPGARDSGSSWTDLNGNLWLFGGEGYDSKGVDGYLNDLWEFNPTTKEWVWVGGSSTVPSVGEGQPGVYGILGTPAAGNTPGGRIGSVSWIDVSGNLWLFGGSNANGQYFNDLWRFDPSTSEWTWMAGSDVGDSAGVYGAIGVPATENTPGGRVGSVSWTDKSGNLWLLGGGGQSAGTTVFFNDLWRFDVSTNEWTWMSGSSTGNQSGAYGTLGIASPGNVPGARIQASSWTDLDDNFWLFGGRGYDANGVDGYLNDFWKFNPTTSDWAWMGGSNILPSADGGLPGTYGTLGTPAAGNIPSGREGSSAWTDGSGSLWLFGGLGWGSDSGALFDGDLNDLWEYQPATGSTQVATPQFSVPSGTYSAPQHVTVTDATNNATIYYTTDGSTPTTGSTVYSGSIKVSSTETLEAIATATGFSQSAVASATYAITVPAKVTPLVTVTPSSSSITTAQPLTVTAAVSGGTGNPTPTGSVTLAGGGYTSAATTLSGGSATINIPAGSLATAVDTLTVSYTPDTSSSSTYNSATGTASVTVTVPQSFTLSATPTSVSVAQNGGGTSTISVADLGGFTGTVTLAATGLPSGVTASFAAGTAAATQVLTLSASSTATLGGPVTVTVTGTSGALSATTTVSLTVTSEPTFGPSGSGGSNGTISVAPGATTGNTATISVAGTNGFSGSVSLSCSITPAAASDPPTCSLSPVSVTLSGNTAQTSTLTVLTTAATTAENRTKNLFWPSAGGTALAVVLLIGVPRRRRNWIAIVGLAMLVASISVIGCGGGGSGGSGGGGGGGGGNAGTSAGTYTVTVTGTGTSSGSSSSVTATVGTVTLTVN
jgi:N-acetylneuraminic acid mutarotase